MKIGIYVHSKTGNTYSVAEKLLDKLKEGKHTAEIKRLEPVGGENTNEIDISRITFDPAPNVSGYDSLVFCAPVRAFSISPVLNAYLSKIASLKGQKVDLFVTQSFPFPFMGGKHAMTQMKKICEEKGAVIGNTGIVNWSNKKRDRMITDVVTRFGTK